MPAVAPFVAGMFSLAAPAIGTAAFGAYVAGAGFSSWLTTSIVGKLLTSVALSALSQALLKPEGRKSPGVRSTSTTRGDVNPDGFILGRYATAGSMVVPPYTHGRSGHKTPNPYLQYVVHLGGAPGQKLAGLLVDGRKATILGEEIPWDGNTDFGRSGDAEGKRREYGREVKIEGSDTIGCWIRYYDGTQTEADGRLINRYGSHEQRPWTADMVGTGICYAIVTFQLQQTLFSGYPQVQFILDGIPLYDPRKDSSAGGSGSQRWGRSDTYALSENPAVQIYNLLRGVTLPGDRVYGGRARAGQMPTSSWFAAMNACDAAVALEDGTSEAAWRTSYEVSVSDEPAAVIEEICAAASIQLSEAGGTWKIRVGAPGIPVAWLTDDDIMISHEQTHEQFPGLDQTYNGASISFPDPESGWQATEGPIYLRADYAAQDQGRELVADLSLPAAPYPLQNQRLARAYVEEERRFRRHVITLPPDYGALEPLDVLAWSSEQNGYRDKLFEVVQTNTDPVTQLVTASLRERDPTDYDWEPGFQLPYAPKPPVWAGPIEVEIDGLGVTGIVIPDADGKARRPAIQIVWSADEMESLDGIAWRVRLKGGDQVRRGSIADVGAGIMVISDGILPVQPYQVAVRAVGKGYDLLWSDWIDVVTPDVRLTRDDIDYLDITREVNDALDALDAWIDGELEGFDEALLKEIEDRVAAVRDVAQAVAEEAAARAAAISAEADARAGDALVNADRFRGLLDQVDGLKDYIAALSYEGYEQVSELRRSLGAIVEGYAASFEERITAAASATGAVAERVASLEVGSTDLNAQLASIETALVNGDEALARQLALLSVGTVNQFDHAAIWYFDSTTENWSGGAVVVQGFLRPTGDLYSPPALAIEAARFSQTRLRLRRSGSLAWGDCYLWWRGASEAWSSARRIAIPEPVWGAANDTLITLNMPWSDTLDQIRVTLPVDPAGTAWVEIDWLAIGRPAPGASSSDILRETQARISQGEALGSDIGALQVRLTDAEGGLTATGAALEAVEVRVAETETGLQVQGQRVENLALDLGGKASIELVEQMIGEIEEFGDSGIRSTAGQLALVRAEQVPLAAELADMAFAALLRDMDGKKVLAEVTEQTNAIIEQNGRSLTALAEALTKVQIALPNLAAASALEALRVTVAAQGGTITAQGQSLTQILLELPQKASASALSELGGTVSQQGDAITAQANDLTRLETALGGKASASGLSDLTVRVSDAEGVLGAHTQQLTDLQAGLDGKASSAALSALTNTVNQHGDRLTAQGSSIDRLTQDLAGKASSSALSALSSTVSQQGDRLTAQGSSIDKLTQDLAGKASNAALSSLSGTVTQQGTDIRAQAEALTGLTSTVDRFSASGLLRIATEATPEGALSRIGLKAAATDGEGNGRAAALYLEAVTGGTSQVLINADRFAVVNGGARDFPFVIRGGKAWMNSAFIQNLSVGTLQIADNAVTIPVAQYLIGNIEGGGGLWREVNSVSVVLPAKANISAIWTGQHFYQNGYATPGIGVRIKTNGTVRSVRITGNNGDVGVRQDFMAFSANFELPAGQHTISVEWFGGQGGADLHLNHRNLICITTVK